MKLKQTVSAVIAAGIFSASITGFAAVNVEPKAADFDASQIAVKASETDTGKASGNLSGFMVEINDADRDTENGKYQYIESTSGLGKTQGDSFIKIHMPDYAATQDVIKFFVNGSNDYTDSTLVSTGKYVVFHAQLRPEDKYGNFTFQIVYNRNRDSDAGEVNNNGFWETVAAFKGGKLLYDNGTVSKDIDLNQWYTVTAVFQEGSKQYKLYVNGELMNGKSGNAYCELDAALVSINKPGFFQNMSVNNSHESNIYMDNFSYYESDNDYDASAEKPEISIKNDYTSDFALKNGKIITKNKLVSKNELLNSIELTDGETDRLLRADELNEVTDGEENVAEDSVLYVTAPDGKTLYKYGFSLGNSEKTIVYEDLYNRSFTEITENNYTTKGLGQPGLYVLNDKKTDYFESGMSGKDTITSASGAGKKADDRFIKIHADKNYPVGSKSLDVNQLIQLYYRPLKNLSSTDSLIWEYSVRPSKLSNNMDFIYKKDSSTWEAYSATIKSDRALYIKGQKSAQLSDNWYRITTVWKPDGKMSYYVDGKLIKTVESAKPSMLHTTGYKLHKESNAAESDISIDNIRYYEQFGAYDSSDACVDITSDKYLVDTSEYIVAIGKTAVTKSEFMDNIALPQNAAAEVYESDEETALNDNSEVKDGMKLAVYSADGLGVKLYTIKTGYFKANAVFYKNSIDDENIINSIGDNTTVAVKCDITANTDYVITAAAYEGDILKKTVIGEVNGDTVSVSNIDGCDKIYVYYWDSINGMVPLAKVAYLNK